MAATITGRLIITGQALLLALAAANALARLSRLPLPEGGNP